jgi:hypothetical protein
MPDGGCLWLSDPEYLLERERFFPAVVTLARSIFHAFPFAAGMFASFVRKVQP